MRIDIRVRANSKQNRVEGEIAGRLLVFVQAPAEDGKANKAVIDIVAKHYKVKARDVKIVNGETSRDKTIEINLENQK